MMCRSGTLISTSDPAITHILTPKLGYLQKYSVTLFRPLEKVIWYLGWQLMLLCPVANSIEVATCVYGIEVDKRFDL
jgi:hypothetical protein